MFSLYSFFLPLGVLVYSDLDWCEANYRHSEVHCELGINVCLLPKGLFSACFHMTLSFMGQMLDEQSILWVLGLCWGSAMPSGIPMLHQRQVGCKAIPLIIVLYITVLRLCWSGVGLWGMAIIYWISDCFGCILWQKLNFCYLHGIWHILIAIAVAYPSTLIAYLDANYEVPYSLPGLQYWPSDNCVLGLPYIRTFNFSKRQHDGFGDEMCYVVPCKEKCQMQCLSFYLAVTPF
uniref:Alkaline ceramidase n=1 Tax=Oncorhynchus mykiss TaxID=8022 RepID=A0A8C7PTN3_ONCMY